MKILITGVAGLLEARLADYVVETMPHVTVVGVDNLSGGFPENVDKRVIFDKLDLVEDDLSSLFDTYKFDYVFHFAAYAAEGLSPFIRAFNYNNNLIATTKLVNQCITHGVGRLVFTSSMAVYGFGSPPFDEVHQPAPIDPYGIAKYACEMDIRVAGEQHSLDWCIIRPHNVYGLKQNIWDKYRNVLGIWMFQHLNGDPMTIFGDGQQSRAFSFIDDCLEPLWKAATLPAASKEIINLGGIEATTILEANKTLLEVIGAGEVVFKEPRHEVKVAHPTWQKSQKILGYAETTDLKSGLEVMWDWAKVQPKRERFKWTNYEVTNGLYSFWR